MVTNQRPRAAWLLCSTTDRSGPFIVFIHIPVRARKFNSDNWRAIHPVSEGRNIRVWNVG
jgi:hypothetical protein